MQRRSRSASPDIVLITTQRGCAMRPQEQAGAERSAQSWLTEDSTPPSFTNEANASLTEST